MTLKTERITRTYDNRTDAVQREIIDLLGEDAKYVDLGALRPHVFRYELSLLTGRLILTTDRTQREIRDLARTCPAAATYAGVVAYMTAHGVNGATVPTVVWAAHEAGLLFGEGIFADKWDKYKMFALLTALRESWLDDGTDTWRLAMGLVDARTTGRLGSR